MWARNNSNKENVLYLVADFWWKVETHKVNAADTCGPSLATSTMRIETVHIEGENQAPFVVWFIQEMLAIWTLKFSKNRTIPDVLHYVRHFILVVLGWVFIEVFFDVRTSIHPRQPMVKIVVNETTNGPLLSGPFLHFS
jgi:hypothetical protein